MENLLSKVLRGDQVLILFCLVDLIILFLVCTKCFFFFFWTVVQVFQNLF